MNNSIYRPQKGRRAGTIQHALITTLPVVFLAWFPTCNIGMTREQIGGNRSGRDRGGGMRDVTVPEGLETSVKDHVLDHLRTVPLKNYKCFGGKNRGTQDRGVELGPRRIVSNTATIPHVRIVWRRCATTRQRTSWGGGMPVRPGIMPCHAMPWQGAGNV
jgi:hypothetical protein